MPPSRTVIECPLCRCRMEVPRLEGPRAYTCRNGHRFFRHLPALGAGRLMRRRIARLVLLLALVTVAFLVAYALAAHRWPPGTPFVHAG